MENTTHTSDSAARRERQSAYIAEVDRKATVMHAQAVSLGIQLGAYADRVALPDAVREALTGFQSAQASYLSAVTSPVQAVA